MAQSNITNFNFNITNVVGVEVEIDSLEINDKEICNAQPVAAGATYFGSYDDKTANQFEQMILNIECKGQSYEVDLNRDHWFSDNGENHECYPGSDFKVNLILMGFDGADIVLMQAYSRIANSSFNYCSDTKKLQPVSSA